MALFYSEEEKILFSVINDHHINIASEISKTLMDGAKELAELTSVGIEIIKTFLIKESKRRKGRIVFYVKTEIAPKGVDFLENNRTLMRFLHQLK